MNNHFPRNRQKNIVMQELLDEVLIYDLEADKAFCLNQTSALIWQECDGDKSITKIAQSVSRKLNTPIEEDLVRLALDNFRRENLLDDFERTTHPLNTMERRTLLKKIGLASMVALPVISSLVAPRAAAAQSGACAEVDEICVEGRISCCTTPVFLQCFEISGTGESRCFPLLTEVAA